MSVIFMLNSLAYVPLDCICKVSAKLGSYLKSKDGDAYKVWVEVDKEMVRGMVDESTLNDIPPRCAPETWNCYQKVLEGKRRTTGAAEAWHRRLENIIEKAHPDFVSFCKALMKEWIRIYTEIEQLGQGMTQNDLRKRNKDLEAREKRIFNVVQAMKTYKEGPIEYLDALARASKL